MTKNMKRMTALACAAMMIASMGITGCGKADGQTKDETKTTAVETPAGTETSATTENEAEKLPDGTSQESGAADTEAASESDPMMGTIVSVEDGQLTMHRQDNGFDEDVVITIAEDTKVLDAENGYPVELSDLKEGNTISAYVDEAMTLSLPPIANGLLILVQAEGYDFPRYTKVKELMAANTEGERILTAENGINYVITAETRLLPYLTRNIVSEEDLTEGTEILIWNEENGNKAEKIVVFQGENGYAK